MDINTNLSVIKSKRITYKLDKKQTDKLYSIRFKDIWEHFDGHGIDFAMKGAEDYLRHFESEEKISGVLINHNNSIDTNYYLTHNKFHNSLYAYIYSQCIRFYLIKTRFALKQKFLDFEGICNNIQLRSIDPSLTDGISYKICRMINVFHKKNPPILLHLEDLNESNISTKYCYTSQENTVIDTIVEKIKPYGYYVEATILGDNTIRMSLNQVIETSTTYNRHAEKSTLFIAENSLQVVDIYEFACDNIWNTLQFQSTLTESCIQCQHNDTKENDQYLLFRSNLTAIMKKFVSFCSNYLANVCNLNTDNLLN